MFLSGTGLNNTIQSIHPKKADKGMQHCSNTLCSQVSLTASVKSMLRKLERKLRQCRDMFTGVGGME